MKRSVKVAYLSIFLLIPLTLYLGTRLKGTGYYLTSTLLILETMAPFFLAFENRKPQARELVLLSVMCALSVAARVAVMIPNFKPMTAVIMLTGIALGPEAGFMTGAVSAFASNFFFSQGPWTPWQMMAYGIGGFLAGVLFHKRFPVRNPWILAVFGFLAITGLVGPLLDCCTLFTVSTRITGKYALAVFLAGFPMNLQHGATCAVTMLVFGPPLLKKLERMKTKYGILEQG